MQCSKARRRDMYSSLCGMYACMYVCMYIDSPPSLAKHCADVVYLRYTHTHICTCIHAYMDSPTAARRATIRAQQRSWAATAFVVVASRGSRPACMARRRLFGRSSLASLTPSCLCVQSSIHARTTRASPANDSTYRVRTPCTCLPSLPLPLLCLSAACCRP